MTDSEANTAPTDEKKITNAQDYYASFIGKQAKHNSLFNTSDVKPVTVKDVAKVTGKT